MNAEQEAATEAVIDWIGRMTARFGPSVFDHDLGRQWDWGQALCREQYGPGWTTLAPTEPTLESVRIAADWEAGRWPTWAAFVPEIER